MTKPKEKPEVEKPKIKPKKIIVPYRSLITDTLDWGRVCEGEKEAAEERKSPSDWSLTLAFLASILDVLKEIERELKRKRTIR